MFRISPFHMEHPIPRYCTYYLRLWTLFQLARASHFLIFFFLLHWIKYDFFFIFETNPSSISFYILLKVRYKKKCTFAIIGRLSYIITYNCSLSFLLFRFSEHLATVELFQTRKYKRKTIELSLFQQSLCNFLLRGL